MLTFLQVDVDEMLESVRNHPHDPRRKGHTLSALAHTTPYSTRYASSQEISKFRIPKQGAPADAVYQLIKDEMDLDGRPQLNLARFGFHGSQAAKVADLGQALSAPIWKTGEFSSWWIIFPRT
jgi:hypothetical protein